MLNSSLVSWCSKRQPTVVLSSTEAEYIALTLVVKEATWMRLLLTELGFLQTDQQYTFIKISKYNTCARAVTDDIARGGEQSEAASLSCRPEQLEDSKLGPEDPTIVVPVKRDNQGSIALAHNPVFHSKTKHIDIQHYYIRDEVVAKRIELSYIPTNEMIANGLTKALTHVKFHRFIEQMKTI